MWNFSWWQTAIVIGCLSGRLDQSQRLFLGVELSRSITANVKTNT